MKKHIVSGVAAFAALASATPALAGTATGTLTSTLSVVTSCSITNGSAAIDFGTIPAQTLTSPLDADTGATLTVNCDGTASSPTLAIGSNNLDTGVRALRDAATARLVKYSLYQDSGRTTEYVIDQPLPISAFTAGDNSVTIYGRIASGTVIDQGSAYSDDVTMTITY